MLYGERIADPREISFKVDVYDWPDDLRDSSFVHTLVIDL